MARDISLIINGNTRNAEAALKNLERTGAQTASILEREFNQLGIRSDVVFDDKREAAQRAYAHIKKSGIASASELARAEKGLSSQLKAIDTEQHGTRLTMAQKFRGNLVNIAAAAGVAYSAFRIGKDAVEQARNFETALTDLGKVGVQSLGSVRKEIMAMPDELGSAQELVEGYYQVISAGVTAPKAALDLLTVSAKAAKAAHVDQEDVIKALTKLMAGYGDKMTDATTASDLLFNIERFGQTTVAELTPVIGALASLSSQLGVMPNEMGAVVAQITQTAGSTAQAATQYQSILSGFIKPTKSMIKVLKDLGYESGQQLIGEKGLSGALLEVKEAAVQSFGPLGLGKIFESKEAITALGPLYEDNFGKVRQTIEDIGTASGATDDAFKKWQGTLEATETMFRNTVGKVMIELGEQLAPTVNTALTDIANWIRDNKSGILDFVEGVGLVIAGVSKAAGLLIDMVKGAANLAAEASLFIERQAAAGTASWIQREEDSMVQTAAPAPANSDPNAPFGTYAVGTRYVPRTGYAQVHRGEEIRTRAEVSRGQQQPQQQPSISFGDLNFNLPNVTNQTTARQLAREVAPELISLFNNRYRGALQGA